MNKRGGYDELIPIQVAIGTMDTALGNVALDRSSAFNHLSISLATLSTCRSPTRFYYFSVLLQWPP